MYYMSSVLGTIICHFPDSAMRRRRAVSVWAVCDRVRCRRATDTGGTLAAPRFADSALPVGGHAVSHGPEQFVQEDAITDSGEPPALLVDSLPSPNGCSPSLAAM